MYKLNKKTTFNDDYKFCIFGFIFLMFFRTDKKFRLLKHFDRIF